MDLIGVIALNDSICYKQLIFLSAYSLATD